MSLSYDRYKYNKLKKDLGSASSFECVNFSECLSLADQRMYQQKRSKNGFKNQSSEIEC